MATAAALGLHTALCLFDEGSLHGRTLFFCSLRAAFGSPLVTGGRVYGDGFLVNYLSIPVALGGAFF